MANLKAQHPSLLSRDRNTLVLRCPSQNKRATQAGHGEAYRDLFHNLKILMCTDFCTNYMNIVLVN